MTSNLDSGKYRKRNEWNATSNDDSNSNNNINRNASPSLSSTRISSSSLPPKPPRRSSLAIGLFTGRLNERAAKRRSSIASTFLGKRDNEKLTKDSPSTYETVVKSEKSDASPRTTSNLIFQSSSQQNQSYEYNENDNNDFENFDTNSSTSSNYYNTQSSFSRIDENQCSNTSISSERLHHNRQQDKLQQILDGRRRHKNFDKLQIIREKKRSSSISNKDEITKKIHTKDLGSVGEIGGGDGNGNGGGSGSFYNRQKRHSWWNVFVPDQLKQRSKSRSVDHGLSTSVDLDLLRSKVDGRLEDAADDSSKDGSLKKTFSPKTITYTVGTRDTLTSVAARFDTTPSELSHMNRLTSSFIYPGQQLLVPDKSSSNTDTIEKSTDEKSLSTSDKQSLEGKSLSEEGVSIEEKDILEGLCPGSPKPGHIKRVSQNNNSNNSKNDIIDSSDDPVTTQRFLKINVRHITDGQGVVGGVLLVTPNAVMFDPNVSDPLVIEHGPEHYGVIAPMDLVVNAAIFHDIAHMRVAGNESSDEKVEIYYPKVHKKSEGESSTEHDSSIIKEQTSDLDDINKGEDALSKTLGDEQNKSDEKQLKDDQETKESAENEVCESNENKRDTIEDRRKSLLDHHWAIPSKERSLDEEGELNVLTAESKVNSNQYQLNTESGVSTTTTTSSSSSLIATTTAVTTSKSKNNNDNNNSQLIKQSCYDSGIDICDSTPLPVVQPIPKKKVYSDADIVLSSDWVPPRTLVTTHNHENSSLKNQTSTFSGANTLLQTQSLDTATSSAPASGGNNRKKTSSVSFSVEDNENQQTQSQSSDKTADQNKKNKMLKRLSYPLTWVEGLTGESNKSTESNESAPNTGDSNQSVFSKVFSRRSSIATFMRPHSSSSEGSSSQQQQQFTASSLSSNKSTKTSQPKLDYRSMVSVDDMPELFVSFDKLLPRPARACQDPPLYLRLRMGKPIGKAIPLPTSVMSYGKNKLRPEYWFSVPKNRVDELHRFINTWVPHLYGELDENAIKARGFELIQHDTEWASESSSKEGRKNSDGEDITELTRESWELLKAPYVKIYNVIKTVGSHDLDLLGGEILSMSTDDYRKASLFATGSFDLDFPIPDLIGETEILTEDHREKLCGHLPARAEGYSWTLVFSTSQHGFSLNSLYRKMQRLESPILIVIEDTGHNVFGALTSCSLHVSDHFYGTGESLLYKFNPTFKVYHWTGENLYFIKGNPESLSIGAGDGKFGLWLDGDLNQGRSQTCSTYGNEPLTPQEDFVVKTLECWAFV